MKKGSIVSLVFSCILFVFGVSLVIMSFRQALTPVSIQHYAEGFTMSLSINNLSLAISSISVMFLILGGNLIVSSILLLILSCYLHVSSKSNTVMDANLKTQKVASHKKTDKGPKPENHQEESVKVEATLVEPDSQNKQTE